jgi:hypothetical protein
MFLRWLTVLGEQPQQRGQACRDTVVACLVLDAQLVLRQDHVDAETELPAAGRVAEGWSVSAGEAALSIGAPGEGSLELRNRRGAIRRQDRTLTWPSAACAPPRRARW